MKVDFRDLLIYFIFLFLALVFFYPFLTGANILSFRDLSLYFYPLRFLMVELVKSFQLPLWNPYLFCGYPLLATLQIGFFYPLSFIYYLLPFNLAFNYYTIIHYFLGALFMYWLMRHYQLSQPSSFLSAIVFAFSGYLISMANMNTTLTSVIWLPLVLMFWDKVVNPQAGQGGSLPTAYCLLPTKVILTSVFLALMFLGGEPTVLYGTVLMMVGYMVLINQDHTLRGVLRGVGWLVAALAVAGMLTAVQLFPFMEVVLHSLRMTKTDFSFMAARSFPPQEMINFLLPFFFGNPLAGTYEKGLLGDQFQTWLLSPYVGIFPLFFTFISLSKIDRKSLFFWLVLVFSFLLSFGRFTPVYGWFFNFFPGIKLIRYPVKFIFLAVFSMAVLSGFGWERFFQIWEQKEKLGKLIFALAMLLILLWTVGFVGEQAKTQIFYYLKSFYPSNLHPYLTKLLWELMALNLWNLGNLVLILGLGLVVIYLGYKNIFSRKTVVFMILVIVILDLAAANIGINPSAETKVFSTIPFNLKILLSDKSWFRYYVFPGTAKENVLAHLSFNQSLLNQKDNFQPNWLVPYRLFGLSGRESIEPEHIKFLVAPSQELLKVAGVKYLLSDVPLAGYKLLRHKNVGGIHTYLYLNPTAFPRVYIRNSLEDQAIQQGSRCEILKEKNNEILLQASLVKPGYLFLSDTYYPGWRVWVDGKEKKIYRADKFFRAVGLEAGKHLVRFLYDPFSFKLGALVSVLSFLGIVGWLFLMGIRQK